ncbi:MAG: hypothetical protein SNG38_05040 [Rikenellaceae bacterium]
MKKMCETCKLRGAYDKNNQSLIGKFWRWHINFCPGWKLYYSSLGESEKTKIKEKYNFPKK